MQILIVIIVLIIVLLTYITLNNTTNSEIIENSFDMNKEDITLYKNKGIKDFKIVGSNHRNLSISENGIFYGYATCEYNGHDKYAVSVYNKENIHIGYVPKNNKRLHDSITTWNNGKSNAWGYLKYVATEDCWFGSISIAVGLNDEETFNLIPKKYKKHFVNNN